MKCKNANNITNPKYSLIILFLAVISINLTYAFVKNSNLQKNKIQKKFSSFLSANDTSENMDALDDLSMFADMENLDELEKVAENLKSKINGEKNEKKDKNDKSPQSKDSSQNNIKTNQTSKDKNEKKIENDEEDKPIILKDFTNGKGRKNKNREIVIKDIKDNLDKSNIKTKINTIRDNKPIIKNKVPNKPVVKEQEKIKSPPKSKKYALIKSKPDYKKMYSKNKSEIKNSLKLTSKLDTKTISMPIIHNDSDSISSSGRKKSDLLKKDVNLKKVSDIKIIKTQSTEIKEQSSPIKNNFKPINPQVSESASILDLAKKIEENNHKKQIDLHENLNNSIQNSLADTKINSDISNKNTNWISILDSTIKKDEEKFQKPQPKSEHSNITLNQQSSPKEEDKKLFSELDPNFVKNLIKMQNDPNIKKLLTSTGGTGAYAPMDQNIDNHQISFQQSTPIKKIKITQENRENSGYSHDDKDKTKDNSLSFEPNFMQLSDFNPPSKDSRSQEQDNSFLRSMSIESQRPYDPLAIRFIQNQKPKEKINKTQIRNYYKPEELDMTKLVYMNDLISKVRTDVQKKTMENDQLTDTNKQLEKNYDQLNNQLMIYQTKMDSILGEIKLLSTVKSSYNTQIEKTREANNLINDLTDFFKKINIDISSKEDSVQKYEEKVQKDLKNFNEEKLKLDVSSNIKQRQLEDLKKNYSSTEKAKNKLIDNIKKNFEDYFRQQIKFLKLKNEEGDLELQVKNEENAEKLIALEIEHLKNTNMIEIQKIEELKQEIEKSKNLRDYLKKEIDELEDKLKGLENENRQNQIEYELKKNELEDKLKILKDEVQSESSLNIEEREKYSQIENDIKNKISYISLQNSNILNRKDDYIMSSKLKDTNDAKELRFNHEIDHSESSPLISRNKISNLVDAFYDLKQKEKLKVASSSDNETKLKKQILNLLKKLNE